MESLGENPFETIAEAGEVEMKLQEELEGYLQDVADQYGRENLVMGLDGYLFNIRNRNLLNTYDVSDEVFDEILGIKSEYDIEIFVKNMTPAEFVEKAKYGNPLMMSHHQWPSIEQWETQWEKLLELRDEHGDVVLRTFFDIVIHTEMGYHERKKYVNSILEAL